jgi:putative membrane protein
MRKSAQFTAGVVSLLASVLTCVAYAQADPSGASGTNARGADSSSDDTSTLTSKAFVKRAAQSNFAEIKVSQLALSKTQNPDVRSFAQQMIDDHSKANSQLAQLAKTKNLKVPDEPDMMHKASMKLLQAKSGESFDSAYIEQMNKDHQKTIDLFQSAASSSKVDPDLQALASKTLPILEQHHQLVGKLEEKKPSSAANR